MTRREVEALARELGYEVKRTAKGHFQCRHPSTGALVVVAASRDWSTERNTDRALRRGAREQTS